MERTHKPDRAESPSRRAALRRLAGAVVAAYVVPEVMILSEAHASSTPTEPTSPTAPEPSATEPSVPSTISTPSSAEEGARETCSTYNAQGPDTISITRSDMARSQIAVQEGYAKPLEQIWGRFRSEYDGKIIGIEFLDRRSDARYLFRAISKSGRLETVTISAQTGSILRIVGC